MGQKPLSALPGMVHDLAHAIDQGTADTVEDAALAVKTEFIAGPERVGLSRHSKLAGRRWGARYKMEGTLQKARAFVRYFGPIHWIQGGTDEHYVVPKGFGGSRARRSRLAAEGLLPALATGRGAKALRLPDGGIRKTVPHPGTKARPFWSRVKRRSAAAASEELRNNIRRNMAQAGFDAARRFR